jgi:glycosyltransferase involved in cell wall biosynthesis
MDDSIKAGDRPIVSVVIPYLKEAETPAGCIDAARDGIRVVGIHTKVVVGDNSSTDGSIIIAERCGARVAHCPRCGYGNALRAGFAVARGEWILMNDADPPYDFRELLRFYAKIREKYDEGLEWSVL